MVQRLPDPPLVPTSQRQGGAEGNRAAQTAPVSETVPVGMPFEQGSVQASQKPVSGDQPAEIPVSNVRDRVDNNPPVPGDHTGGFVNVSSSGGPKQWDTADRSGSARTTVIGNPNAGK